MLKRYSYDLHKEKFIRITDGAWVRYEDAEALQMRVIELEQKLKTQDEPKAEFEKECALELEPAPNIVSLLFL